MPSSYLVILGLSALSAVTALTGVVLARLLGHRPVMVAAGVGFAAAMMIVITVAELVPAVVDAAGAGAAALWLAVGAGSVALAGSVARRVRSRRLEPRAGRTRAMAGGRGPAAGRADATAGRGGGVAARLGSSGLLVAVAIVVHDVPEGISIALAYLESSGLGVLLAVALAVHNLPEQFAAVVTPVTVGSRRQVVATTIAVVIAEPGGALVGIALHGISASVVIPALGVAAGAMGYAAVHELLPQAWDPGCARPFATGAAAGLVTYVLLVLVTSHLGG